MEQCSLHNNIRFYSNNTQHDHIYRRVASIVVVADDVRPGLDIRRGDARVPLIARGELDRAVAGRRGGSIAPARRVEANEGDDESVQNERSTVGVA